MAIFDWQGKPPSPFAKIFDASGIEHTKVIRVDSETGELERYITDRDERILHDPLNHCKPLRERKIVPAPVSVIPY